jgi:hypothetical protein
VELFAMEEDVGQIIGGDKDICEGRLLNWKNAVCFSRVISDNSKQK